MTSDEEIRASIAKWCEKISDEKLHEIAVKKDTRFLTFTDAVQMADELYKRRQADRAIWENAPEWADWWAKDQNGQETWFENEPVENEGFWYALGRFATAIFKEWEQSKQERPK